MKRFVSILLVALMVFSCTFISYGASDGEVTAYDGYPVIIVEGIEFAGLVTEDGSPALEFGVDDVITFVSSYIIKQFIEKKDNALVDSALETVNSFFANIATDNDGNSLQNLYAETFTSSMADYPEYVATLDSKLDGGEEAIVKTAIETVGAENTYFFTYDWRKSPEVLADELSTLVDTALETSGKGKVNIACVSMGGMVTTAYMYYKGYSKINNLVYVSSAHNGTYTLGDSLSGNIHLDGEFLAEYFRSKTDNSFADILITVLETVGIFDVATNLFNDFVTENEDLVYGDVLRNTIGTALGLWGLCPDDRFDEATELVFGGYEEEYSVFIEKLERTRDFVVSTEEIIDGAFNSGINISFLSNYGSGINPLFVNSNQQGDGTLETSLTSNFATTSKFGKTLTDVQINAADAEYLSPDKMIDASTCLYPDCTWFIKDARHVAARYNTEYSDFVFWLLLSDGQQTVYSNALYPRFMSVDAELNFIR